MGGRYNQNAGVPGAVPLTPVDTKGVQIAPVPQFIEFEPTVAVAAAAAGQVLYTVGVRDFHCTHIGFTSQGVGVPAMGMIFRLQISDIGASRTFQPHPWNTTAAIGTNPATSDHGPLELPVEWVFEAKTAIRIDFANIGGIPCIPTVVLIGYLGKLG